MDHALLPMPGEVVVSGKGCPTWALKLLLRGYTIVNGGLVD